MDEAMGLVSDTSQFKFDVAMATARESLLEIGTAILTSVTPYLDNFIEWMENHGPTIETGFTNIYNAIDKFLTSEVLANIIEKFKNMWPEIKEAVFQLGELVGILAPVLLDAINDLLPSIGDFASIMDDLGFFTGEVLSLFGEWEGETPNIVEFLEKQLNPIKRIQEAVSALATALNAAREAYDRLTSVGLQLREGGVAPGTISNRRAAGGDVLSGQGYLVGERGPELFVPGSSGSIIPNNRMGGGSNINITVNAGMGANGAQIGQEIVSAIKRYERTSGPVFASA
jgi:hypothetical protein